VVSVAAGAALNPRQEEIRDELLLLGTKRPVQRAELGRELKHRLTSGLRDISSRLSPGHTVLLNKHRLSSVHSCEGFLLASDRHFEWTPAAVRGRLVHRAIESLVLNRYRARPLALAEQAVDDLAREEDCRGPGEYLRAAGRALRQDLVRDVNDALVKFLADWPPIEESWKPRLESPVNLAFGKVKLRAKFDLALGLPVGLTARTFIVDFKTGAERAHHSQDGRLYALLETVRSGTPPYRVATYYLDSGSWRAEDIDESVLDAALRRVLEGASRIAAAEAGGPVSLTPGPVCGFCPDNATCPEGRRWLDASPPRWIAEASAEAMPVTGAEPAPERT
jgi:RecB family exonuclease